MYRRYPKGLRLKFNLSLCSDRQELQRHCNSVLRNASLKLRDIILKSVEFYVKKFCKEQDSQRNKIKAKVSILDLEIFRTMFHEKLKIYLAKSDTATRNTSVMVFLMLKAI